MNRAGPPRATVVIPTRNRSSLLRRSLASALVQSLEDIEVIVIDNASVDDTADVVASFADDRVQLHRERQNVGMHSSHTIALHSGTAPFIAVLQDDDLLSPTALERKVAFLETRPEVGVVCAAFDMIDGDGRQIMPPTNWMGVSEETVEMGTVYLERTMASGARMHLSTTLMRRSLVTTEAFREADAGYCDMALFMRLSNQTNFAYLHESLGSIRLHAGSVSLADGLHVVENGQVSVVSFEQVRVCHAVKQQFLKEYSASLPVRHLSRVAANHARHELGQQIAQDSAHSRDPRRTVRLMREAHKIEPTFITSKWGLLSAAAVVGGPRLLSGVDAIRPTIRRWVSGTAGIKPRLGSARVR